MATIKIPVVKSTKIIVQEVNEVTFADGIVIKVEGANNATTRKPLYLEAYAKANIPVITPPVILPPANKPREISYADFAQLTDVEGVDFVVKGIETNNIANHNNIKNCSFDLSKVKVKGSYGALRINGKSINAVYNGLTLQNVEGYQIETTTNNKVKYNGAEGSSIEGLKINGFNYDGGGQPFHSDGDCYGGITYGVLKNFQMTNCVIKNINYGDIIYIGGGLDAKFENLIFDNINASQNNHNGVIRVKGNLIANKIKATNYQGNLIRNWLYSIEGIKDTYIKDLLAYFSRKYSAIEFQMDQVLLDNNAVPGNALIENCSVISMNTSKENFDGLLADVYNTGTSSALSTITFRNNLGADLNSRVAIKPDEFVNRMNNPAFSKLVFENNKYFKTKIEAFNADLSSKFKGIGATL